MSISLQRRRFHFSPCRIMMCNRTNGCLTSAIGLVLEHIFQSFNIRIVFKNDIFKVKRMKLFVSSHFSSISNIELKKFLTRNISSSSTVENVFYCFSLANMDALVAFHVILYKLTNLFVNMSFFIAPTE